MNLEKNKILTRLFEAKQITLEELLILNEKETVYVNNYVPYQQPWINSPSTRPPGLPITYCSTNTK